MRQKHVEYSTPYPMAESSTIPCEHWALLLIIYTGRFIPTLGWFLYIRVLLSILKRTPLHISGDLSLCSSFCSSSLPCKFWPPWSSSWVHWAFPGSSAPWAVAWKHSLGSQLGKFQGSPHLFTISQGSLHRFSGLLFVIWWNEFYLFWLLFLVSDGKVKIQLLDLRQTQKFRPIHLERQGEKEELWDWLADIPKNIYHTIL